MLFAEEDNDDRRTLMRLVDSHQHFWKFDPLRDTWITQSMTRIRRDFLPADLQAELTGSGVDCCVAVQADQSETENEFLLGLAAGADFIKGVVGWVDLCSGTVEERLEYYRGFPAMKGFRHVLQGEAQRDFMLRPDFLRGIGSLLPYGFAFDILIHTDQLRFVPEFVQRFPDQRFVIDHLAKPNIASGEIAQWEKEICLAASFPNVCCKVSGLVTEADWAHWSPEQLKPYLDVVTECFGTKRLLFGSDWPVCLVAAEYGQVLGTVKDYFAGFSRDEQAAIFSGNAARFYRLGD